MVSIDFADVKPSVLSWVIVGIMAVTFITFAKWLMTRYPVPGLSDVIASV